MGLEIGRVLYVYEKPAVPRPSPLASFLECVIKQQVLIDGNKPGSEHRGRGRTRNYARGLEELCEFGILPPRVCIRLMRGCSERVVQLTLYQSVLIVLPHG